MSKSQQVLKAGSFVKKDLDMNKKADSVNTEPKRGAQPGIHSNSAPAP